MNMEWVKQWRRQRLLGMLPHVKQELIARVPEDPDIVKGLISKLKQDPKAMQILEDNSVTFRKHHPPSNPTAPSEISSSLLSPHPSPLLSAA